ncbi:hypothetical protein BHE74_00027885 [Ensete ventricosum]|nr:hypothetical protein BHE74_00027885 [Ensete ventricosum]
MRLHASKLDLPFPSSFSPSSPAAVVSSVLFEPSSRSLSLMLVDSSALLYPSLLSSATPVTVPPPSTAACFLRLLPSATVLFLSAAPLAAGSSVQLRAWILLPRGGSAAAFAPARLDYRNDRGRSAVALPLPHGLSVRLAGSVNVFVVHSIAASQIWVFAARLDAGAEATIHLVKCAVVELTLPIYSITLSMGFMLIGEVDGVRVFPLRPLVKGRVTNTGGLGHKKVSALVGDLRKKNLPNGLVIPKSRVKKSLGPDSGGGRLDCRGSTQGSADETMADGAIKCMDEDWLAEAGLSPVPRGMPCFLRYFFLTRLTKFLTSKLPLCRDESCDSKEKVRLRLLLKDISSGGYYRACDPPQSRAKARSAIPIGGRSAVFGVFHQSVYSRLDLVNPRFYLILQVLYPKKLSLALVEFL